MIEAEMNIQQSETYPKPSGARYLVGSKLAPIFKSRYPVHCVAVDVKSTRTIVDKAFSVPNCVRLARYVVYASITEMFWYCESCSSAKNKKKHTPQVKLFLRYVDEIVRTVTGEPSCLLDAVNL